MQKNILLKVFLLIFFLSFFSCKQAPVVIDPFTLSHLPHIQQYEKQDHVFCSSPQISSDNLTLIDSQNYWRCRLSLAKYRIITDKSPESERHNLEISDLVKKISLKISQTSESILAHENTKLDERHHKQCLNMGYDIATTDQTKIDDYFACRFALLNQYTQDPPYGNESYLKYPNASYNNSFIIDRRIEKDIQLYSKQKDQYPDCVKFNIYSENFKRCTKAKDASDQCFKEIDKKKFIKEWEEKVSCQKYAYKEFPDKYLKPSERESEEAKKTNSNSDYYNSNSFSAIGIDVNQFSANNELSKSDEEKQKEKVDNQIKARAEINSKNKLYDRFELTKLRQKYISSCVKEADSRVTKYVSDLKNSCEILNKFKTLEEENND